jgi:hypothetical protein
MTAATLLLGGCGGHPDTGVVPPASAAYEGFLDDPSPSSKVIHGWVWDANRPDEPVDVDLFDGETHLGKVKADLLRRDLQKAGKGNGRHGYEFPVPDRLMDGRDHRIQATIASSSQALTNSPRMLRWTK